MNAENLNKKFLPNQLKAESISFCGDFFLFKNGHFLIRGMFWISL